MANAGRSIAPGAIPRGCYASYRGNLAGPPRKVEQNNRTFAAGRMGVNMAAPDVPSEEREKLTEWVNIIVPDCPRRPAEERGGCGHGRLGAGVAGTGGSPRRSRVAADTAGRNRGGALGPAGR